LALQTNAFPINRFPSRSLHPWASAFLLPVGSKPANWYGSENTAKIRVFYEIVSLYPKKEYKITFHKACETTFGAKNSRKASKNLEVKRKTPIFAPTESATLPVVRPANQGGSFILEHYEHLYKTATEHQ
jgi:hypothetical protein